MLLQTSVGHHSACGIATLLRCGLIARISWLLFLSVEWLHVFYSKYSELRNNFTCSMTTRLSCISAFSSSYSHRLCVCVQNNWKWPPPVFNATFLWLIKGAISVHMKLRGTVSILTVVRDRVENPSLAIHIFWMRLLPFPLTMWPPAGLMF